MSDRHLRSNPSALFERSHRNTSVLSGVFRPIAQRACRARSERSVAMRRTLRQTSQPRRSGAG